MSEHNGMPRRDFLKTVAATGAAAGFYSRLMTAGEEKEQVYKIGSFWTICR